MKAFLFLLVTAAAAIAQPWQWELVDPDWRNPSGVPQFIQYYPHLVGDFTGDGLAEIAELGLYLSVNVQGPAGHWRDVNVRNGPMATSYHATAQDLDGDAAQEMVVSLEGEATRCFKLDTSEVQWQWIERPDLIEDMIPEEIGEPSAITWANFDHDAAEEAALVRTNGNYDIQLLIFERTESGQPWILTADYSIPFELTSLYAGDFEHDGDTDLALQVSGVDDLEGTLVFENTPEGLEFRELNMDLIAPGGGNLDGDEAWEFLYFNTCFVTPYSTYDGPFVMDVVSLDEIIFARDLRRFEYIVGNLRGTDMSLIGMNNFYCFSPWGGPNTSRTDFRDLHGDHNPLFSLDIYAFNFMTMGDVNGDGLKDMLGMHASTNGISWENPQWKILLNVGDESHDEFALQLSPDFIVDGHDFQEDYSSPRLGDIDGDGRAELILHPLNTSFPGMLEIYRMEQLTPTEVFTRAFDLEEGLPDSIQSFEAADLDGDGIVEILPYIFGARYSYFFHNGQWESHENIIPHITSYILGFADWDNNGTTDIFTNDSLYLNMTPTAVDDDFVPHPSSFTLSAYPNPFNAQTTIAFDLPKAGDVSLKLFDLLGRKVETILSERMNAGTHSLNYNASELPSGVYFASLESGTYHETQKLMLLK